jgi:hypothetical protein
MCLRNGTLDVNTDTGIVYGMRSGQWVEKKLTRDDDGYLGFYLARERERRVGKAQRELRKGKIILRYRNRRYVLVHRLVKLKALAVAKGGQNWRQFVSDKPLRGWDVNHLGAKDDNRNDMLELQSERANRSRTEMTDEEWERQREEF